MKGWEDVRNARFKKQLELGLFERPDQLTPRNPKVPEWDSLTQEEKERYDMQMAIYAAVIEEVDRSIGRVVEHLKEKGVLDNTLIILLSDNGGNGEPGIEGRFAGKNPGSAGVQFFWVLPGQTLLMHHSSCTNITVMKEVATHRLLFPIRMELIKV